MPRTPRCRNYPTPTRCRFSFGLALRASGLALRGNPHSGQSYEQFAEADFAVALDFYGIDSSPSDCPELICAQHYNANLVPENT